MLLVLRIGFVLVVLGASGVVVYEYMLVVLR